MTATLQTPWGADGSDIANNAPNGAGWEYTTQQTKLNASNVQPTTSGWAIEYPNGIEETIVAIGGLISNLHVVTVESHTGTLVNTTAQMFSVFVRTNLGVNLGAGNTANLWLVGIATTSNVNVAVSNVNLLYNAAGSAPQSGEFSFTATVDLSAVPVNSTITINSTSTLHGNGIVLPRQPLVSPVSLTSTPIPSSINLTFTVT